MEGKEYVVVEEITKGSQVDNFYMFENDSLEKCKEQESILRRNDVHGKYESTRFFTVIKEDFESGNYNEL